MIFFQECEDYLDTYGEDPFIHLIVGVNIIFNNTRNSVEVAVKMPFQSYTKLIRYKC